MVKFSWAISWDSTRELHHNQYFMFHNKSLCPLYISESMYRKGGVVSSLRTSGCTVQQLRSFQVSIQFSSPLQSSAYEYQFAMS
jgi:hypothetical protein